MTASSRCRPARLAEVAGREQRAVLAQLAGRAAGRQLAVGQDVAAVSDLQRQVHVLLHQQDPGPVAGRELPHHREQPVHDHRGQAQAHLVEHEQPRPAAEHPREGEHLLLAAGQQARLAAAQRAQRREVTDRRVQLGAVQPEVLGDGQAEEDAAVGRDVGHAQPGPRGRGDAREVLAGQPDHAAGRLQQPGYRPQRRGLAGAVGAEERDDLAGAHGQRQVAHDRRAVVADAQVVEFEDVDAISLQYGGQIGHWRPR